MRFRLEVKAGRLADPAGFDVLVFAQADRYGRIRKVGKGGYELKQFFFNRPERLFLILDLLGYGLHFVALFSNVGSPASESGDFLGAFFAELAQAFNLDYEVFSLTIQTLKRL
jgi:hypothetical protein